MKISPNAVLTDRNPKYTVKQAADLMELSTYTVRYYDNAGLIPAVDRSEGNIRLFSDYAMGWLRLIHCLRMTGLPIEQVRNYVNMCQQGDSTIEARADLIFAQEESLREQLRLLHQQMEVLEYKKKYYENLLANKTVDSCNPKNLISKQEPNIFPKL